MNMAHENEKTEVNISIKYNNNIIFNTKEF